MAEEATLAAARAQQIRASLDANQGPQTLAVTALPMVAEAEEPVVVEEEEAASAGPMWQGAVAEEPVVVEEEETGCRRDWSSVLSQLVDPQRRRWREWVDPPSRPTLQGCPRCLGHRRPQIDVSSSETAGPRSTVSRPKPQAADRPSR